VLKVLRPTRPSRSVHTGGYKVRLMVLPVRVYNDDHTKFVDTYGFLDSGSEMSVCTTSLKLHLQGKEVTKNIVGLSGSRLHRCSMVTLSMKGLAESNVIRIRNVFAIDALSKLAESIPSNNDVERYENLRGLHFPEVHSKEVEVLIGAEPQFLKRMRSPSQGTEKTLSLRP